MNVDATPLLRCLCPHTPQVARAARHAKAPAEGPAAQQGPGESAKAWRKAVLGRQLKARQQQVPAEGQEQEQQGQQAAGKRCVSPPSITLYIVPPLLPCCYKRLMPPHIIHIYTHCGPPVYLTNASQPNDVWCWSPQTPAAASRRAAAWRCRQEVAHWRAARRSAARRCCSCSCWWRPAGVQCTGAGCRCRHVVPCSACARTQTPTGCAGQPFALPPTPTPNDDTHTQRADGHQAAGAADSA